MSGAMQTKVARFSVIDARHDVTFRAGVFVKAPKEFMDMYPTQLVNPEKPFNKNKDVMVTFETWEEVPIIKHIRQYPSGFKAIDTIQRDKEERGIVDESVSTLHVVEPPALETHGSSTEAVEPIIMPNLLGPEVTPAKSKGGRPKGSKTKK